MPNDYYRDIYKKSIVDHETGETVETEAFGKKRVRGEIFFFVRMTDGMPWLTQFNSLLELQVLMYMMLYEDPRSGKIIFSSDEKLKCSKLFKVVVGSIDNTIRSLRKLGHIRKVSNGLMKVDPKVFYNGGSKAYATKIKEWKGDSDES
jgi:hypothetical protein